MNINPHKKTINLTKAEVKKILDAKELIHHIAFYCSEWGKANEALDDCIPTQEIQI